MLQSMTGYGKASCETEGKRITVEIKSLNSKQMDVSTRLPFLFRSKDIEIRNLVSRELIRGKVDLFLFVENLDSASSVSINEPVLEAYCRQVKQLCASGILPEPADWGVLLRLPDVMKQQEQEELSEEMWAASRKAIEEAIEHLKDFRRQEGVSLHAVFEEKVRNIGSLLEQVDKYEKERVEKIKNRMREQLENLGADYDKNRFEQELIFYIEKLDVSEEKNRLRNHLKYFIETMDGEEAPGKKLGFIAQEIGREVNTLGSKSNHSEMQILVVRMKDELEQIKEQVLNAL